VKNDKKRQVERLLDCPIAKNSSIALISSFCLGDTLINLVLANNFLRDGYQIELFGDYAYALRDWFPQFKINPLLSVVAQDSLKGYDYVIHMYESELSQQLATWHPASIVLSDSIHYRDDMTMTDIQVKLCRLEFGLERLKRENDITPLPGLGYRNYPNRIIVHPTSSLKRKNWPAKKFIKLAKMLQREGFENCFIVSEKERRDWLWVEQEGISLPFFRSLSDVAKFIYESGYFIGNDSGIGHLASNLGIPTISIILRKGVAKQWRPSWAPGKVVLSPNWLNPRPIKEKLWKIFTRVATVKAAFESLREDFK
jgi:heptosyltransferase III